MPIYEYRCKECHQVFEDWVKAADSEAARVCPVCNYPAERLISCTSFVLNGNGWYVTDYGFKSGEKNGEKSGGSDNKDKGAPVPAANSGLIPA